MIFAQWLFDHAGVKSIRNQGSGGGEDSVRGLSRASISSLDIDISFFTINRGSCMQDAQFFKLAFSQRNRGKDSNERMMPQADTLILFPQGYPNEER
jgi:hypothetical protein